MNLTKFIAVSGFASRRRSADLIVQGHVTVNGENCVNPGTQVTEEDEVRVDGTLIKSQGRLYYIMLHKPRGYVCTMDDIHAEKKAIDLIHLPEPVRLFSAGRLDKNSEGLILFSNDGNWVATLTHPRYGITKIYQVTVDEPLTTAQIHRLTTTGIVDDGECLRALNIIKQAPGRYLFKLGEGKNREIRRMIEGIGNRVRRLKRIAVGNLRLGNLPMGQWRELTADEVQAALGPSAKQ